MAPPTPAAAGALDLSRARDIAVEAAEAAGALLREAGRGPLGVSPKGVNGDVVTALDLAAEALILDRLRAAFPGHQVVAEEAGVLGAPAACVWLVDPLDGTNNLAVGLSDYVVGIALAVEQVPVLGVVHDPVRGQTFSAVTGRGAHGPTGVALCPAHRPAPHGPLLAWTQGHGVRSDDGTARALKLVMESTARRVFQLWAPLLSWVMLARGDIDGFVGYHAEAVDLPAGLLIAQEAGVAVCGLDGAPFDPRIGKSSAERCFVAGHPANIARLTELVAAAERLRPDLTTLPVPARAGW